MYTVRGKNRKNECFIRNKGKNNMKSRKGKILRKKMERNGYAIQEIIKEEKKEKK